MTRYYVYYTDQYNYGEMPKVWKYALQDNAGGWHNTEVSEDTYDTRDDAINAALVVCGDLSVANDMLPHELEPEDVA